MIIKKQIALLLAAVARMQIEFDVREKVRAQSNFLKIAADLIDCSVPSAFLMAKLKDNPPQDQVTFLIHNRSELHPVFSTTPAAAIKKLRIKPSQWPKEHAKFIRLVFLLMQDDSAINEQSPDFKALLAWLRPAFVMYPSLEKDILTSR